MKVLLAILLISVFLGFSSAESPARENQQAPLQADSGAEPEKVLRVVKNIHRLLSFPKVKEGAQEPASFLETETTEGNVKHEEENKKEEANEDKDDLADDEEYKKEEEEELEEEQVRDRWRRLGSIRSEDDEDEEEGLDEEEAKEKKERKASKKDEEKDDGDEEDEKDEDSLPGQSLQDEFDDDILKFFQEDMDEEPNQAN